MFKTTASVLLLTATAASIMAGDIQPKDENLPHGVSREANYNNGYWVYGTVVKLGATNSNPVIVIRTGSGDYTYTIQSRNSGQILQLATQALVSNLSIQAYAYDNYGGSWQNGSTPYITALYIYLGSGPLPTESAVKETK